jgi:transposase
MTKDITKTAGVDVSKAHLDLWTLAAGAERFANDAEGIGRLVVRLGALGIERTGLEASGGYERALLRGLQAAGLEGVRLDPAKVRALARFKGLKAKTDALDARLIAEAAALSEAAVGPSAPARLVEQLTWLEQLAEDAARLKTRRDGFEDPGIKAKLAAKIQQIDLERKAALKALAADIKADVDLAQAYALLLSLPGVGPLTAATLLLRMPELGAMNRAKAASLAGLAPFNRDSGFFKGQRRIWGGRIRVRRPLYMAALAALRGRSDLARFGKRLIDAGKPFKLAITAVMRKLVVLANVVLSRGAPYETTTA